MKKWLWLSFLLHAAVHPLWAMPAVLETVNLSPAQTLDHPVPIVVNPAEGIQILGVLAGVVRRC